MPRFTPTISAVVLGSTAQIIIAGRFLWPPSQQRLAKVVERLRHQSHPLFSNATVDDNRNRIRLSMANC